MATIVKELRPISIKINDIFRLKIISKGRKRDGIAKIEDFIIIVPLAKVGQEYNVKITKVLPKFAFGEITKEDR